jgi:hypothetical protein
MILLYVALSFLLLFCMAVGYTHVKLNIARTKGIYPEKGCVQKEDILRLVSCGENVLAMRAYRELNHCGLIASKKAVRGIRHELNSKK